MNTFIDRYKQVLKLSFSDFQIIFLPLTSFLLSIRGDKKIHSILNGRLPKTTHRTALQLNQLTKAKNIAKMLSITANNVSYKTNYLEKKLVSYWLLYKQGIQIKLKISINKNEREFNTHAWLEFQGTVLNDAANIDKLFNTFKSYKSLKS